MRTPEHDSALIALVGVSFTLLIVILSLTYYGRSVEADARCRRSAVAGLERALNDGGMR